MPAVAAAAVCTCPDVAASSSPAVAAAAFLRVRRCGVLRVTTLFHVVVATFSSCLSSIVFLPHLHSVADCDDDAVVAEASTVAQKTAEVPQARHAAVLQSAWRRQYRQASKGRDSVAALGLVSPCNLGLRIFAPEAVGRRDILWFDVLAGYGYGIDVSIVYLISVRLSSSHLSNGSIRVLGGSTTMSSHWKQVHTAWREQHFRRSKSV